MADEQQPKQLPPAELDAEFSKDEEALQELIDCDFSDPTRPKRTTNKAEDDKVVVRDKKSRDYKYYEYVRTLAQDWWDEFNTAMNPETGAHKYRNISQFIAAKTKNRWEQVLLYESIGPMPEPGKTLRVPWLGEWRKRRTASYYSTALPNNIKRLALACEKPMDVLETIKSSARYLVHRMSLYAKMTEMVHEAFGGQPGARSKTRNMYNRMLYVATLAEKGKGIYEGPIQLQTGDT